MPLDARAPVRNASKTRPGGRPPQTSEPVPRAWWLLLLLPSGAHTHTSDQPGLRLAAPPKQRELRTPGRAQAGFEFARWRG
ncbi:hypothetical protein C2E23DRAFT_240500 [Lenzites betulinus]|nr:hypothetical protein C2E23DRAFT_240500 [Lenzites betulinus]